MSDLKVELSQVDKSDLQQLKNIMNSGFNTLMDENQEFCEMNLPKWYENILQKDNHTFSIRVSKSDGSSVSRSWLVGVCGITDVDWVSRHGRIVFVMVDKDGHKSTLQNHPASQYAFKKLLKHAFLQMNLNKVWVSSLSTNSIDKILASHRFYPEGIRRNAVFSGGKYVDESIFSLISSDFLEKME
jgi:RimJ/RimL family protein N-acetyltransferase